MSDGSRSAEGGIIGISPIASADPKLEHTVSFSLQIFQKMCPFFSFYAIEEALPKTQKSRIAVIICMIVPRFFLRFFCLRICAYMRKMPQKKKFLINCVQSHQFFFAVLCHRP